jgi:hypothetical protein
MSIMDLPQKSESHKEAKSTNDLAKILVLFMLLCGSFAQPSQASIMDLMGVCCQSTQV